MTNISIEPTKYTPKIIMDADNGTIEISGKSYPENTFEFYAPVITWLEEYFNNPKETTTLNMEIIYFNSSTSKLLFDLFDFLEDKSESYNIIINWIYDEENETALEAGEEFMEDFETLNINLKEK